ncbi:Glycine--tRNA ligase beta subunit [Dissostichus eleginoides]|uniref:Glycine--tRNA ligase beta subunit n=1 Tax=Dissostichus eleginoides TaxID=100907 RepID=A0AAD9FNC8_DISEL|nr:Glycine--tRNA ligase beta subunit [Dissostichus eleginoides]
MHVPSGKLLSDSRQIKQGEEKQSRRRIPELLLEAIGQFVFAQELSNSEERLKRGNNPTRLEYPLAVSDT